MKTILLKFRRALIVVGLLIATPAINAQDIIILNDGQELAVKIREVSETDVKYKKVENLNGPLYTTSKTEIFVIKYENGTKEIINKINAQPLAAANSALGDDIPIEKQLKFSGPRIGYTYLGSGTSADFLTDRGKQPFISQFGWQFEKRVFTLDNNGAQGLIEFVPMIGGLEQGMFLPSGSFLIGMRTGGNHGFEIALGPNVSLSGMGIVLAAGTSFKAGRVNFPVNLAFVPSVGKSKDVYDARTQISHKEYSHTGFRISLVIGFNTIRK